MEMIIFGSANVGKQLRRGLLLVGVAVLGTGCERMSHAETRKLASGSTASQSIPQVSAEFNPRLLRRFSPVRLVMAADPSSVTEEMVTLGRLLFFDERLSKNQKLSCNSWSQPCFPGASVQACAVFGQRRASWFIVEFA